MAAPNRARSSGKVGSVSEAKLKVISLIRDGHSVREAMTAVGRKESTYIEWRRSDPEFRRRMDVLREQAREYRNKGLQTRGQLVPDFPEFSATYLGHTVPELHMRTYDMMRGLPPRNLHANMVYHPGRSNMLLINYPPDHGKSTTWSVNYPTYQIVKDPNTRGAIISKTGNLARQFLGAIKNRLENPRYRDLQLAFSPEGGFQGESWTQSAIYVGGRDSGEKDPTVQALGMGAAVYGARLDWVILDDCIDTSNAHRYDEQLQWLSTEVLTRLPDDGLVMILGTRIAPMDLYRKLRELQDYNDIDPLYTYLSQPAVLDQTGTPDEWDVLWPERWPGPALARRKATLGSAARWALVYQQMDVSEEAVFPVGAVEASINRARAAGHITGGSSNAGLGDVRPQHLHIVAGLDPATTGFTSMVVVALDRMTGKRIVLDGFNRANCTPQLMREQIKHFTTKYKVKVWVIERNAFQRFLTQDEELRTWLYGQGCRLREHFTSANKYDEDYGVMSMAPLFLSCVDPIEGDPWQRKDGGGLIDLPNRQFSSFTDELVGQLVTWQPKGRIRSHKTDLVMALWMAEIECHEHLDGARTAPRHSNNPFLPRRERERRAVVRLDEYAQAAMAARVGGTH